jgi:hypothetical protein
MRILQLSQVPSPHHPTQWNPTATDEAVLKKKTEKNVGKLFVNTEEEKYNYNYNSLEVLWRANSFIFAKHVRNRIGTISCILALKSNKFKAGGASKF